ncbi:hypothetical protein ABK040_014033 [Willaertia magna]
MRLSPLLFVVLLLLIFSFYQFSSINALSLKKESKKIKLSDLQPCDDKIKKGEKCLLKILNAHPAQIPVGLAEVYCKVKQFEFKYEDEASLNKYLAKHTVPVVKGPSNDPKSKNAVFYVVDHHHLLVSLYLSKFSKSNFPNYYDVNARYVIAEVVNNYSNDGLDTLSFWRKMVEKGFAYTKDERGLNLTLPNFITTLPSTITKLKNDPYRSLSGFDRYYGGYAKDASVFFVDFIWANFLREQGSGTFSPVLNGFYSTLVQNADVNGAVKVEFEKQRSVTQYAVKLSESSIAKGLPGYGQGEADIPDCFDYDHLLTVN